MEYRLMQEEQQIEFNKIDRFSDLNNNDLTDIIKFTGCFKNVKELKLYLFKYNLIKNNASLSIDYTYHGKNKSLKYGITTIDNIRFINDINITTFISNNRYNQNLINRLYKTYCNNIKVTGILERMREYSKNDIGYGINDYYYLICSFVNEICYNKVKSGKKLSIKNLRDLGMFLDHESKVNDELKTNDLTVINDIKKYTLLKRDRELNREIIDEMDKPKVKVKKIIPGQMSFDIDQNGNLKIIN